MDRCPLVCLRSEAITTCGRQPLHGYFRLATHLRLPNITMFHMHVCVHSDQAGVAYRQASDSSRHACSMHWDCRCSWMWWRR